MNTTFGDCVHLDVLLPFLTWRGGAGCIILMVTSYTWTFHCHFSKWRNGARYILLLVTAYTLTFTAIFKVAGILLKERILLYPSKQGW